MPSDVSGKFDVLTAGQVNLAQMSGTVQTVAGSGAIIINSNQSVVRVTTAGAVTGITMPVGTQPGQFVCIIHEGAAANTITFAAAGTSNVADGVSDVITGPSAVWFAWDSVTALWYRCH